MLRLWPGAPKMTSSCATRPGNRTECTCTPSGASAPRAPASTRSVVGSGGSGGLPAWRRAAAITAAVWMAVPDGASRLASWCSSMISTPSMCGAAIRLRWSSSTAPMAKLGTTTALAPLPEKSFSMSATSASDNPLVPMTAWMPRSA